MKLTRGKRIALELLGPPALGAIIMTTIERGTMLFEAVNQGSVVAGIKQVCEYGALVLVLAHFFAGLQSVLYTVVMEWRFSKGLDPASWKMVKLSSVLGFGSGAVLIAVKIPDLTNMGMILLSTGGLGLVVGFIMGLLIKRWSTEEKIMGENLP